MNLQDYMLSGPAELNAAESKRYAREDLIYNVTEDILVAMESLDLSKNELARKTGKSKSCISQMLSGARNMTLGTLSDICFALEVKPKITIKIETSHIEIDQETSKWEVSETRAPKANQSHLVLICDNSQDQGGTTSPNEWTRAVA